MRTHLRIPLILATTVLVGCSGLGYQSKDSRVSSQQGSNTGDRSLDWRYGNFCGKGHPSISSTLSKNEQVQTLLSIRPADDIDLACQLHDVCYAAEGKPTNVCDRALAENLSQLRNLIPRNTQDRTGLFSDPSGKILGGCEKLNSEIEMFAAAASGWNKEVRTGWDILEMGVLGYGAAIMTVVNTPAMLIGGLFSKQGDALAVGSSGILCVARQEPKLIAPYTFEEVAFLRECFNIDTKFRRCRSAPLQGRMPRAWR